MANREIGNYVHYSAAGYNNYGIFKREEGKSPEYNYSKQKQNIMNRTESLMTFRDKEGMESILNRLFSSEDRSEEDKEIWDQVTKKMQELFGETLGKINTNTGDISSTTLNTSAEDNKEAIRKSIEESDTYLKTIYTRLNAIEAGLSKIKDSKTYKEIDTQVKTVYKLLNQILQDGKSRGLTEGLRSRKIENMKLSIEAINTYKTEQGDTVLTILNNLVKNSTLFAVNNSLQKGTLFEYLIAAVPAAAKLEAGNTLEEFCGKVTGQDRDKVKIDFKKNNFLNGISGETISKQIKGYSGTSETLVSYGYSQGKIDVDVTWKGQKVPISAKNVKLSSGYDIHIVSGTSLLYLLQDEDSTFVNHYFNVIADHKDGVAKNAGNAHEAAKMTILFKALTGKTFGRDSSAEVFVVNDNSTGKVCVFDMKDLLKKAYQDLDKYSTVTANGEKLETLRIANKWAGSYIERINNFIADVHRQKISATLKPSLIKS